MSGMLRDPSPSTTLRVRMTASAAASVLNDVETTKRSTGIELGWQLPDSKCVCTAR